MNRHEQRLMAHYEREARRALRRDFTALWRGSVAGLLFVIAAHALEQSYLTGLLGQALTPSLHAPAHADCAILGDAVAERLSEQGQSFNSAALVRACEGKTAN